MIGASWPEILTKSQKKLNLHKILHTIKKWNNSISKLIETNESTKKPKLI